MMVEPGVRQLRDNSELVASRPDVICHLAAVVSAEAELDFDKGMRINLDGSRALLDAVRGIGDGYQPRLVFTSSIAVYGVNQLPMTEDLTPSPEDPYGIGKYAVELDLAAARRLFGLNSIIFRPHNVYGEG